MWPMIAEPRLRCSECQHIIQPGRLCLSELPEEMPVGVNRSNFRNYCIGCPQCWRQGRHACYVRYLKSGNSVGRTPRSLPCARCGQRIAAGDKAGVDIYYEWPEALENEQHTSRKPPSNTSVIGTATTAAGVDTLFRGVPSGSFEELSDSLQRKFIDAGLGGERGFRTAAEANALYQDSIPYPVRNLGEGAIRTFTEGKDASHIESVSNAPNLASHPGNLIWEDSALNRSRGAENVTGWEEFRAHGTNAFDASAIVFRECLDAAAMTAMYASLLEAPVSAIENYIHYQKGHKTGEEAIKDAAIAIAKRAATGATVGFAVTGAVALVGAGPLIVSIAPILIPVGMVLYGYTAIKRILSAIDNDKLPLNHGNYDDSLPLNYVGTYFCSLRCHTIFAYETGESALIRWETQRASIATT